MSGSTRRGFVKNSAGAAAGMTVIGALVAEQADADGRRKVRTRGRLRPRRPHGRDLGDVRRARSEGAGSNLAARIARAAR